MINITDNISYNILCEVQPRVYDIIELNCEGAIWAGLRKPLSDRIWGGLKNPICVGLRIASTWLI